MARSRTFAIRAKASPAWGIREIAKALARSRLDVARQRIGELLPFWNSVAPGEKAPGLADQVLHVASVVDDDKLATALVAPLAIEQVTPKQATRWLDLLGRYGLTWCAQVFERWTSRGDRYADPKARSTWLVSLPALAAPVCAHREADGVELVRRITHAQWTWLNARLDGWIKPPLSSYSLKSIRDAGRPIVAASRSRAARIQRNVPSLYAESTRRFDRPSTRASASTSTGGASTPAAVSRARRRGRRHLLQ